MATVVARSANKYLPFAVQWSGANSDCPTNLRFSRVFRFRLPRRTSLRQIESPRRDVSRPETLHLGAPETPTRRERCRAHLGDQGNPIEEHAPPRPRAAPQAPAEAGRRDLARASRGLARRCDGVVPRPERPRRGRVLGHFQRRHRAFVRFRARFRCLRAVRARGTGSTARRCPRASRSASGGSETASEPSDAVLPDDPGLLRAMRRPRLAASSVAAFLSQRDGLCAGAWETERAAETSDARADEASEAEGSGDDRPDDRSLGTERTSGSPRDDKNKKGGALPAALVDEGASSEARGRERRRGSISWCFVERAVRVDRRRGRRRRTTPTLRLGGGELGGRRRRLSSRPWATRSSRRRRAYGREAAGSRGGKKPKKKPNARTERRKPTPTPTSRISGLHRRRGGVALRKKAEKGKKPFRHRHPRETWNGGAPGLCRLAAPVLSALSENNSVTGPEAVNDNVNDIVHTGTRRSGSSGAPYATECFLSRSYTEGFGAPVAFAAYPSADVLCRACGDVAGTPCASQSARTRIWGRWGSPRTRPTCGAGLPAGGWRRRRGGGGNRARRSGLARGRKRRRARRAQTRAVRHALYAVSCERESLADERVRGDAETEGRVSSSKEIRWRMDPAGHGCPDSGRLCDREQTERDCSRAVRVCGLPGDANPGDACLARVRAGDVEAHAASCAFQLVPCSRRDLGCTRAVRRKHAEAHFRLCEYRPFACPNRPRCAPRGLRRDVEAHLRKECAWEIVPCGLVDDDRDGALARSRSCATARWRGRARVHVRGDGDSRLTRRTRRTAPETERERACVR